MTVIYEKTQINEVIEKLKEGKVIAFPTDTVYGLGVRYHDEEALTRLKQSKGRPESKPIPTMVANKEQLAAVAHLNEDIEKIVSAFLPGALTLVMNKSENVPEYATNGLDTIGVRMPDDPFVLKLIEGVGVPMLVTSANLSGEATGTTFEEVMAQLNGRIDGIVKGTCGCLSASTIIDVTKEQIKVLREGPISREEIEKVLAK